MSSAELQLVDAFEQFYQDYYDPRFQDEDNPVDDRLFQFADGYPRDSRSFYIDYSDLYQYDPELAGDWMEKPKQMQAYAEAALQRYDFPIDKDMDEARVRLSSLERLPPEAYVDINNLYERENKYAAIEGQVNRVSQSGGITVKAVFECQRCGTTKPVAQSGDELQQPYECPGCERQGPFEIRHDHPKTETEKYQLVRLQEPPEKMHGGEQAGEIDVSLRGDIVNELKPGQRVTVGVPIEREQDKQGKKQKTTYHFRGTADNIRHEETDFEDIDLSNEDLDRIHEIAESENPYQRIVDSIKPGHMGDEMIKMAIALQMFGGVTKRPDSDSTIRGWFHILWVGDPSTDKSGILEYVAKKLAPRSVYTSGKNATSAGLTCAAVQDDFGDGGWTLEGGAMVQAHKGLCAIDEFDKISDEDRKGLHEALAQGHISPSKAGITNVEMPAEASVLAAANPKQGRYDPYQSPGEQIGLGSTMIPRFDLVFVTQDQVDEERDRELARHILNGHKEAAKMERGHDVDGSVIEPEISNDLIRKYVAYARRECTPVLTDKAARKLEDFYVDMRKLAQSETDPIPITARKLEAGVRLSEASARVRLSDTVEAEDAERVIELVMKSLRDIGKDPETGEFDADFIESGTTQSQRDRKKKVKAIIIDLAQQNDAGAPVDDVLRKAAEMGLDSGRVEQDIEKWAQKGELYRPSTDHVRFTEN